VHIVQDIASHF